MFATNKLIPLPREQRAQDEPFFAFLSLNYYYYLDDYDTTTKTGSSELKPLKTEDCWSYRPQSIFRLHMAG